ncbi:MAG: 5' nucleotidase, NT5C type [Syntrophomonadaceae bacterium]|jgi:uncharacterized HAD superfamily protein
MIIGIDIDNTISYTTQMIMHYAGIYGQERGLNTVPDLSEYYLEQALGWPKESVEEFFDLYLERIYRETWPKEQAAEVISRLQQQHRIVLITSRNYRFPGIEEVTREWLKQHGVVYDELVLNATPDMYHFSKLGVCLEHGINIMIEDHHDLARELSEFMPVILFDYPYNRQIESDNVFRVSNWAEAWDWVEQLARNLKASTPIA